MADREWYTHCHYGIVLDWIQTPQEYSDTGCDQVHNQFFLLPCENVGIDSDLEFSSDTIKMLQK